MPTTDPTPTSHAEIADFLDNLPLYVREKRRREHLSLREAADQAGVDFGIIHRLEAGKEPRLHAAKLIVRWLGH